MIRWGLVATVKAPPAAVLDFVAYHLALGAHRVFLYLDAPAPALAARLNAHPRVRAIETDAAWWARRKGRPHAHQVRQQRNARHAYRRAGRLDWLAHIDVDEFLCPIRPIAAVLNEVPEPVTTARVRPVEALADAPGLFKACHHGHPERQHAARRLYPTYGAELPGGFLSHVAGKAFIRTGLAGVRVRIHGIDHNGQRNPAEIELPEIELAHLHAQDWERWRSAFPYRHGRGSYRAALPGQGGVSRHALFANLLARDGEAGLRHFFDEVVRGTPRHVAALRSEGLLRHHDLELPRHRAAHFPEAGAPQRSELTPKP